MDSLTAKFSAMTKMFHERMSEFQQQLERNSPLLTSSSLASDFKAFKTFILTALSELQSQVELLSRIMDRQEMKTRRKMLLFHGVPEDKSENVSTRITTLVAENLNLPNFSSTSIKSSYRLGRSTGKKPRPIVVKFSEVAIRDTVWFAKTRLKGTGITQSEFLTKQRHDAFLAARERFGVSKCWTRDGCIFILAPDGTRNRAECLSDLDEIPDVTPTLARSPPQPTATTSKTTECRGVASRSKRPVRNK